MQGRLPQAVKTSIKTAIAASGSMSLLAPPLRSAQNHAFNRFGREFRDQYVRFLGHSKILSSFEWRDPHHGRDILIPVESGYPASWSVALSCLWSEPGVRRVLDRFIELHKGARVFFDVGSNHGYRSYPFLAAGYTCVLFEPQSHCNAYVERTCRRNGFSPIIEPQLVGDQNAVVEFWESECSWYSSAAIKPPGAQSVHQVQCETLDHYCERTGRQPALIKIDVEGHEAAVLRGAESLLVESRPPLVVEVWRDSTHKGLIYDLTCRNGYEWYAIETSALEGPLDLRSFLDSPRQDFFISADRALSAKLSR